MTAANYFRKIAYGCEQLGMMPGDLTKMDTEQAKFFIHDLISHFGKGAKGSSIESYVKSMKSWMTWNDTETPKSIRVYGASDYN